MNHTMNHTIDTDIRRARRDDLDHVATILAAAFHDDPIFAWCIPDRDRRRRILPTFFGLVADAIATYDEIHLAPGGAAMWVPPGRTVIPDDEAERFESSLAELFGPDAGRTFELIAMMDEHHPTSEHHYLWFLGVEPGRQGAGTGSKLLDEALSGMVDPIATPSYLEATSERNLRLYERHGFTVVDELRTPTSPTLWAMWRPAAMC